MSFVGLTEDGWQAFIVRESGQAEVVDNVDNPRQFTWSPAMDKAVYLTPDGTVIVHENEIATVLVRRTHPDAFTQFRLTNKGQKLLAVRLFNRQSEKTAISVWDTQASRFIDVHQQIGQVFDPYETEKQLYYSAVSCVIGCGLILQEAWLKNMVTQQVQQLTLHNGTLRYPTPDIPRQRLVYSLNTSSQYHLWQVDDLGRHRQLTHSLSSDIWPSVTAGGDIYFIRRGASGGILMVMNTAGDAVPIVLPHVQDIRDLEINQ